MAHIAGTEARISGAPDLEAARETVSRAAGGEFRIVRQWPGRAADCYLIEVECSATMLVWKRPHPGWSLVAEATALQRANDFGLAGAGVVPRLHAILPGNDGILTEYVPGMTVAAAVREQPGEAIASKIAAALHAYHGATGSPVGDLHERNVIVRPNGATLIDPASPSVRQASDEPPPLVIDLASWTTTDCALLAGRLRSEPTTALRALRFTPRLLAACALGTEEPQRTLDSVDLATREMLDEWARTSA